MADNPYHATTTDVTTVSHSVDVEFMFDIEGHQLLCTGTLGSGLERIYLDGELVSKKRSFARHSLHPLNIDGTHYDVVFSVKNPFVSNIVCELRKGTQVLEKYCCQAKPNNLLLYGGIFIMLFCWTGYGYARDTLGLPHVLDNVAGLVILGIFLFASIQAPRHGKKIITRLPVH